jgi:hypothetical protein
VTPGGAFWAGAFWALSGTDDALSNPAMPTAATPRYRLDLNLMGALLFVSSALKSQRARQSAIGLEGWHRERSRALWRDIHAQSAVVRNGLKRYPGDALVAEATLLSPES